MCRVAAQPALCITHIFATKKMKDETSQFVFQSAAQRKIATESSTSKYDAPRPEREGIGNSHNVLNGMLPLWIDGHQARKTLQVSKKEIHPRFKCSPFTEARSMTYEMHSGNSSHGLQRGLLLARQAVHNYDNGAKTGRVQFCSEGRQSLSTPDRKEHNNVMCRVRNVHRN